VANVDQAAIAPCRLDQPVAALDRVRHGLLEQQVLAGVERRNADLRMGVVGGHDVDHVDRRILYQGAVVAVDRDAREIRRRGCRRLVAAGADRSQARIGDLGDRLRVKAAERAIPDQAEPHGGHSAPPVFASNRCIRLRSG
jgi:hypothetical protein